VADGRASSAENVQHQHEQQRSDHFAEQPAQLQHSSRLPSRVPVVADDAIKELHAELEDKDKQIARLKVRSEQERLCFDQCYSQIVFVPGLLCGTLPVQQEFDSQLAELKAQLQAQQAAVAHKNRGGGFESQPSLSRPVSRQNVYEQQQQPLQHQHPQRIRRSEESAPSPHPALDNQEMWARPVRGASTLQALDERPVQEVVYFQPEVSAPKDNRRQEHGLDDDEIFRVDPTLEGSSKFVYPDGRSFVGDRSNSHGSAFHHLIAIPQSAQAPNRSAQMFQSLRNIGALDSARTRSVAGHDLSPCSRASTPPLSECTDNFDLSKYYDRNQQRWALISGMDHPDDDPRRLHQLRSLQTRGA
jgi:hypothetical protein